ncbi:30S ribosome-binding factor RbfA [Phenylobacterium sp.]|uniref:30S ribosome-binding factor RbfA n=1 Tax=Phenylobacterium sp. TaxID=1871053 RepID=UPI002615C463|nr:30S ribosome-binding factor RbfA [Phenylobacterium sp.]
MKRRPPSRTPAARTSGARPALRGPSQRQLRAGELVRHALVEILREEDLDDPALSGAPVTITEVRVSPDLRHAVCFIQPLGGENAPEVVAAMNRASKFFRGRLGRMIDLRATPELKFLHDETFDAAEHMSRLFEDPKVRQDLDAPEED